jgi:hypothetical protein
MNALTIALTLASLLAPATEVTSALEYTSGALAAPARANRDWIAKSSDNVCGLKEPSQVSNPAVVDWQALLDATPEVRKLRSEKISEDSPEGIQLLNEATNRVTQACESLRSSQGHCSVWKAIRHKDGRAVTDITDLVKAQL